MDPPCLECPCGAKILPHEELRLTWTPEDKDQLRVLCPEDSCYLREVGYIRFRREKDEVKLKRVTFYPPFSSWNLTRLGRQRGSKLLRLLAKNLLRRKVSWTKLDTLRQPNNGSSKQARKTRSMP